MKTIFLILLLALGIFPTALCLADGGKPDDGPPPKWVVLILFNPRAKLEPVDPAQEMRWILKDRQIDAHSNETFHHEVRQILSVSGLNNGSHISVDFEPNYQLLTFHWVKIWRGTNALDRLKMDKIQISQHGLDTDELIFHNEKTALLLLSDVRVGDIIDCAYTLQGDNPVFAGRFSGRIETQGSQPIDRMTTRLLWPVERHLFVKNHGTDVKYTAVRKDGTVEFSWNFTNVPGRQIEPPLPSWYHPFPWVQLSEFQKWTEVNHFALALFTNTGTLSPEMAKDVREWKRLPSRENQVLAALRLVQEDVRYLGIESGLSSYMPAPPSEVLTRRYGDCKDKTLLFVTLLRALGIEAYPTLVNTRLQQSIAEFQPSATLFDHAISEVILDGQVYWLDATANYERGPLAVRSWPRYGYGLVMRPTTVALTPIIPSFALPQMTVNQYIDLGQPGQSATFKMVTVAFGSDAEALRSVYSTTARATIERDNLNYYAKFYPDIQQTAPLVYMDDEQQNRVEVDEFYRVDKIWSQSPNEAFYRCRIYPENIEASMGPPAISLRTMPMAVAYPVHQFFHAEITAPVLSAIQPDEQTIENPAFYFHRSGTLANGRFMLNYEYRSLTDVVLPGAAPNYVRQLDAASHLLGYSISSD